MDYLLKNLIIIAALLFAGLKAYSRYGETIGRMSPGWRSFVALVLVSSMLILMAFFVWRER